MNKEFSQKLQDMVKISEILDRHGDSVGSAAVLLSAFGMVEKEVYRLADELDSMTKTASTEAHAAKQEEMIKMAGIGQWLAELAGKAGRWLGGRGEASAKQIAEKAARGVSNDAGRVIDPLAARALALQAKKPSGIARGLMNIGREGAGEIPTQGWRRLEGNLVKDVAQIPTLATKSPAEQAAIQAAVDAAGTTQAKLKILQQAGAPLSELKLTPGGLSSTTKGIGAAGLGLAGLGMLSARGKPNTPPYQPTPSGIPGLTPGVGGLGQGMAPGGGYGGGMGGGEIAAIQSAIGTLDARLKRVEQKVGLA